MKSSKISAVISTGKNPENLIGLLSTMLGQSKIPDEILILNYISEVEDRTWLLSNNQINFLIGNLSKVTEVRIKSLLQPENFGSTRADRYEFARYDLVWSFDDDLIILSNDCLESMYRRYIDIRLDNSIMYPNISPKIICNFGVSISPYETEFRKFFYPETYGEPVVSSDMADWAMLSNRNFVLPYLHELRKINTAEGTFLSKLPTNAGTWILDNVSVMHVPKVTSRDQYVLIKKLFPSYMENLK